MKSVADALRDDTVQRVLRLPVEARIELAFALGREDLERYAQSHGLDLASAQRCLVAQRRQGRNFSRAAASER